MKKPLKIIVISAASLALVGGVGAGIAAADPSSSPTTGATPSASASPSPGSRSDKPAGKSGSRQKVAGARVIRRALHGEVTLAGRQHQVVVFQRGRVVAVNGSSITVRSNDAFTGTYAVAATTKVRVKKEPAAIGDVGPGDRVVVIAAKGGDVPTARLVVRRGA